MSDWTDGYQDWVDTEVYLSRDEIRSLERFEYGESRKIDGRRYIDVSWCVACKGRVGKTDPAHIARKQMGGRKDEGPVARLCRKHHDSLDGDKSACMAIRMDGLLVWLNRTEHGNTVYPLSWTPFEVMAAHPDIFTKVCPECGGIGRVPYTTENHGRHMVMCETCGGSGQR